MSTRNLPTVPSASGSYRLVYDLGYAVLKVDRDLPNDPYHDSNASEYAVWRRVRRRKEAVHFARIIRRNRDGSLLMERADSLLVDAVPLYKFDQYRDVEPAVLRACERNNISDIHPYNIGIFNGKQKIIDYQGLV